MSRCGVIRAYGAKNRLVSNGAARACLVVACFVAGACTADTGVTVDVDGTPEGRWEMLDPVAGVVSATSEMDLVVGTLVPEPVAIHVTDKWGQPFSGLTVTWEVSDSTAGAAETSLTEGVSGGPRADDGAFAGTITTVLDGEGRSAVVWEVGTVAGPQTITATVAGPGGERSAPLTTVFDAVAAPGKPTRLILSPKWARIEIDGGQRFVPVVTDQYGNSIDVDAADVQWTSTDESVATVDRNGRVTPRKAGTAAIFASVAYQEYGAAIQVVGEASGPQMGSLSISPHTLVGSTIGQSIQLRMDATDSRGSAITPLVSWTSTNPSVVSVSGSGRATATGYGTAFVRATGSCCSADSVHVTVRREQSGGSSVEPLDWFCDWSGATGSSAAAYEGRNSTGACFTGVTSASGDFLSVQAANPNHGFPAAMTNVLRIEFVDDATKRGSKMVQAHQQWATPEVGEYIYYRFYDYNDFGPNHPLHAHWFHGGSNRQGSEYGGGLWGLGSGRVASDMTYDINYGVGFHGASGNGRGQGYFRMYGELEARTLYRREHRIHRTNADSVRHQVRISDGVTGEILFTGADFACATSETGGCVDSGGFARDTIGQYKARHAGANSLNSIEIGNNGANQASRGLDPRTPQYWYIGGMAVRVTSDPNAWIGSYPVAGSNEGRN